MKKKLLALTCLSTLYTQAMEETPKTSAHSFSTTYGNTIINVTKGPISSINGKVGAIFVGNVQQQILQPSYDNKNNYSYKVGHIECLKDFILYEKKKDSESASDDDIYKPFENPDHSIQIHIRRIKMTMPIITIIEPRITEVMVQYNREKNISLYDYEYYIQRDITIKRAGIVTTIFTNKRYVENEAIKKASQDLEQCYSDCLLKGYSFLQRNKNKSIALSALSTEVGFPRKEAAHIAIPTILLFIKKNPHVYDRIELFVKKRSEFKLYQELLIKFINGK